MSGAFMSDPWWIKTDCNIFSSEFLLNPLPIIVPPLFHIHQSAPPNLCCNQDQAVHYHTVQILSFVSDPIIVWFQSKVVCLFN
jgi:hypothetical protein